MTPTRSTPRSFLYTSHTIPTSYSSIESAPIDSSIAIAVGVGVGPLVFLRAILFQLEALPRNPVGLDVIFAKMPVVI